MRRQNSFIYLSHAETVDLLLGLLPEDADLRALKKLKKLVKKETAVSGAFRLRVSLLFRMAVANPPLHPINARGMAQ